MPRADAAVAAASRASEALGALRRVFVGPESLQDYRQTDNFGSRFLG